MATPNYQFEKRRRELDKKAKKEEKRKQKLETASQRTQEGDGEAAVSTEDEVPSLESPPA